MARSDFTEKEVNVKKKLYYIGIDVHMRKCTTTIKGRSKKVLDQFEFDNDLQGIGRFIRRVRLRGHEPALALFESTGNYWKVLHGELKKTAIKPILVNPYDLKIITQAKFKDDNRDSERLCDLVRGDFYKPSHVPTEEEMDLRELVRTRLDLRYDATEYKNHVHAILAKYPLKRPADLYTIKGREWLQMAPLWDYDRMVLDTRLVIINAVEQRISLLEKEDLQDSRLRAARPPADDHAGYWTGHCGHHPGGDRQRPDPVHQPREADLLCGLGALPSEQR